MPGNDKIIFTEEFCQPENLHPFTLTRRLQDIRVGILTIREKWERMLGLPSFDKQEDDYKDKPGSLTISQAAEDGASSRGTATSVLTCQACRKTTGLTCFNGPVSAAG